MHQRDTELKVTTFIMHHNHRLSPLMKRIRAKNRTLTAEEFEESKEVFQYDTNEIKAYLERRYNKTLTTLDIYNLRRKYRSSVAGDDITKMEDYPSPDTAGCSSVSQSEDEQQSDEDPSNGLFDAEPEGLQLKLQVIMNRVNQCAVKYGRENTNQLLDLMNRTLNEWVESMEHGHSSGETYLPLSPAAPLTTSCYVCGLCTEKSDSFCSVHKVAYHGDCISECLYCSGNPEIKLESISST